MQMRSLQAEVCLMGAHTNATCNHEVLYPDMSLHAVNQTKAHLVTIDCMDWRAPVPSIVVARLCLVGETERRPSIGSSYAVAIGAHPGSVARPLKSEIEALYSSRDSRPRSASTWPLFAAVRSEPIRPSRSSQTVVCSFAKKSSQFSEIDSRSGEALAL